MLCLFCSIGSCDTFFVYVTRTRYQCPHPFPVVVIFRDKEKGPRYAFKLMTKIHNLKILIMVIIIIIIIIPIKKHYV